MTAPDDHDPLLTRAMLGMEEMATVGTEVRRLRRLTTVSTPCMWVAARSQRSTRRPGRSSSARARAAVLATTTVRPALWRSSPRA